MLNQESLPNIKGSYRFDVDLSKSNWFGVGGPAEILFRAADLEDLISFLKNKSKELAVTVLGVGSNIIIKDGGIKGVVIKLGSNFAQITHHDDLVKIGAASLCINTAIYSRTYGLGGLEFLSGIPGSIGGALAMNAGCYGLDISQILTRATAVDLDGNLINLQNQDFGFKYRGHSLSKKLIFVAAEFKTYPTSPDLIAAKIKELNSKRAETQPIRSKTGGSTFKNPEKFKAWQLIDQAGCRGLSIGGAQISEKHCNFMINNNQAKASDLIALGNKVKEMVKEKSGIDLEWEIKIIGEDPIPNK